MLVPTPSSRHAEPAMSLWQLPPEVAAALAVLAGGLDPRNRCRLAELAAGVLFARGRRTVTRCLRPGGLPRDFQPYYYFLSAVGRRAADLARRLLVRVAAPLLRRGRGRPLFGLGDRPHAR